MVSRAGPALRITFANKRLRRMCCSLSEMQRKWGARTAGILAQRLYELDAVETLEEMRLLPAARCHELTEDRKGHLAVAVGPEVRLIIAPDHNPVPMNRHGGLDWSAIKAVAVVEIIDYHK
jgi:plasmid maintenance system killer protein